MKPDNQQVIIVDADLIPSGNTTLNELNRFIEALRNSETYDTEKVDRAIWAISTPIETLKCDELKIRQTTLTVTKTVAELLEKHKEETGETPSAFLRRMIQDHIKYGRPFPQKDGETAEEVGEPTDKRIGLTMPAVDLKLLKKYSFENNETASAFLRRAVYACLR